MRNMGVGVVCQKHLGKKQSIKFGLSNPTVKTIKCRLSNPTVSQLKAKLHTVIGWTNFALKVRFESLKAALIIRQTWFTENIHTL